MALGARPNHAPRVADVLGGYMDELWYVAGDRSTNLDWYARRAGLLSVYVATELHLLADSSEGQTDTWCGPMPPIPALPLRRRTPLTRGAPPPRPAAAAATRAPPPWAAGPSSRGE